VVLQVGRAQTVFRQASFVEVLTAIEFNYKSQLCTVEIQDIGRARMLSANLNPAKPRLRNWRHSRRSQSVSWCRRCLANKCCSGEARPVGISRSL